MVKKLNLTLSNRSPIWIKPLLKLCCTKVEVVWTHLHYLTFLYSTFVEDTGKYVSGNGKYTK